MKKNFLLIFVLAFTLNTIAQVNIIPQPAKVKETNGQFSFTNDTKLLFTVTNEKEKSFVELTQELLKETTKLPLPNYPVVGSEIKGNILIQLNTPVDAKIGNEGYRLNIQKDRIFLNANSTAGLLYGIQSLWQLLSAEKDNTIPCMEICDYPRFGWRGMHLDVSRHFMPAEFIYKFIDYIALHKMNVFHWHLVDDQGWRIEIKKYPKLTEVGAWRADREHLDWNSRKAPITGDEPKYGGFYSQEEVQGIVAYAQKRNVAVIPEIEMPAHVMSALAAYPEYSCTGDYIPVPSGGIWPITHIFCAGKEETFTFLEDILAEVMDLFPSTYIHIGGDEATKTEWEKCELCQKRIKDNKLKDEHELQAWFIKRIEKYLNANGRKLVGWDEILEGGLNPSATIMSWRGSKPGTEAAKLGHDVVMSPTSHCYFDYYQGNPEIEPTAFGGFISLKKVYHYEPIPEELSTKEAQHIIGAQANVWTEHMKDGKHVEYMIMPRMSALSEVLWSPQNSKDWGDFSKRMKAQYERFEQMGINYATSAYQVTASPTLNPENKSVKVSLSTEAWNPEIRYTLDGSEPNYNSLLYSAPFEIIETTSVKAVVVKDNKPMSKALTTDFFIHKAVACPVGMKYANSKHYDSSGEFALVDGIKGTKNHGDGNWKGFNGDDLIATIDLGETKSFSEVSVGVLQNTGAWIFYPTDMLIEVSNDGESFKKIGSIKNKVSTTDGARQTQDLVINKKAKARYLRVSVKNLGVCPEGHGGEGKPAWLFVDEIAVR